VGSTDGRNRVKDLVDTYLAEFYKKRLEKVNSLRLKHVLRRKNPYLFRAKGVETPSEIVEQLLKDYLSSSDETIFGNEFLEPLAREVSGGHGSSGEGVDFEIETDTVFKAVSMKSGMNWGNASQKKRLHDEFMALNNRIRKLGKQFDAIVGHAYGIVGKKRKQKFIYRDVAGQAFWKEMTGDSEFYTKLIEAIRNQPKIHKAQFDKDLKTAVERFTEEFRKDFCKNDGSIDWTKLTKFVSEESDERRNKSDRKD